MDQNSWVWTDDGENGDCGVAVVVAAAEDGKWEESGCVGWAVGVK